MPLGIYRSECLFILNMGICGFLRLLLVFSEAFIWNSFKVVAYFLWNIDEKYVTTPVTRKMKIFAKLSVIKF